MSSQPPSISQPSPRPPLTAAQMEAKAALKQANMAATAAQIAHFRAIPWCAKILSQPGLVITQSVSRRLRASKLDALFSRTLNTPDAIPAYITFYSLPPQLSKGVAVAEGGEEQPELIKEVASFVALGPMVNGWEGVCHGGLVASLLDELMGQVFAANKTEGLMAAVPVMTGYLNTRFEKPVLTGGSGMDARVVLVTGRLVKREGRKYWLEGDVRGEDGVVLARGESLFVMLRDKGRL